MHNSEPLVQTWRWYGPKDPVSLQDIRQAGAKGIVSALHHIPHGEVWPLDQILTHKSIIEESGLTWAVVESLPVHESIKVRNSQSEFYLNNYRQSLRNLAKAGLKTICYNFMPVLDWTRTNLAMPLDNGGTALSFNWVDLAIFDIYILKRKNALDSYSENIRSKIDEQYRSYPEGGLEDLKNAILLGVPTEELVTISSLENSLDVYNELGKEGLFENLFHFLRSIEATCEEEGILMTIHPDDPPYPILGLPRIASNLEDLQYIYEQVNAKFNGFCFCTGSLGAGANNDVPAILDHIGPRVYFAHLRNVSKDPMGNFHESDHLDGDVDMYQVMKKLVALNQKSESPIPFRPDHGHQVLDDLNKETIPGYSAIGRLKGLAELRGLELGILGSSQK
ncbi:mannonate dehydratase [Litoribacter alkaliphilus]|uniref:Mannonate dehydratase n=1 Tax=Litoribacter ruber TaxID=702568 RepID=A0AAP2CFG7_9BACT|nr:mannonate dehydratase [Litoribacter alkaliphilus]MBS9522730.1 mannonate dehydratase [Litoribacter alkaliphilus]